MHLFIDIEHSIHFLQCLVPVYYVFILSILSPEWDFIFNNNLSHKQLIYLEELHVSTIHAYEALWKSWQTTSKCPIFMKEKLFSCSMKRSEITLFSFFKGWHLQLFSLSSFFTFIHLYLDFIHKQRAFFLCAIKQFSH
jgi:hypothetical protein